MLKVGDGVFEILSTSGDTYLGGDDFDKEIVDWLAARGLFSFLYVEVKRQD